MIHRNDSSKGIPGGSAVGLIAIFDRGLSLISKSGIGLIDRQSRIRFRYEGVSDWLQLWHKWANTAFESRIVVSSGAMFSSCAVKCWERIVVSQVDDLIGDQLATSFNFNRIRP